jgi:hypothetical protein
MPSLPVGTVPVQTAQTAQTARTSQAQPSAASTPTRESQAPAPKSAPADGFKTGAAQPAAQGTRPADGLKAFSELTPKQQALLGENGEARYNSLTSKERTAFMVLSTRMEQLGLDTQGLALKAQPQGIQEDRMMFEPRPAAAMERLQGQVKELIAGRVFKSDKPEEKLHPGMSDSGARQWSTRESMQIGFGKDGAFVDVDRFGVKTDLVGIFGHLGEVVTPGKTDLSQVAKRLHIDVASRLPPAGQ